MQFPDLGPAEEQLEFVLPRIADPTEKLKAILNTALLTLARPGLGHRGGDGPSLIVRVKHQSGEVDQRPGPFDQAIHVNQLVLDRLERTNRYTELLSLSGVVEVQIENPLACPQHRGSHPDSGLLHGSDHHIVGIRTHEQSVGTHPDALQIDGGVSGGGIDGVQLPGHYCLTRDDDDPQSTVHADDHGDLFCGGSIHHKALDPRQDERITIPGGRGADLVKVPGTRPLVYGQGSGGSGSSHRGEELLLLIRGSSMADCWGELGNGGREGPRRDMPTHLLKQDR